MKKTLLRIIEFIPILGLIFVNLYTTYYVFFGKGKDIIVTPLYDTMGWGKILGMYHGTAILLVMYFLTKN